MMGWRDWFKAAGVAAEIAETPKSERTDLAKRIVAGLAVDTASVPKLYELRAQLQQSLDLVEAAIVRKTGRL